MEENDFERVLAESFNNAHNNNVPISTSEANNVNDIFVGNEVKTECIICYEEHIACIKCFKCTAVYCKICLTKIASESNKCICAIEIKANYSKLKKYNQDLIKKSRETQTQNINNRNNSITTNTYNRNNSNANNNLNANHNYNTNSNSNSNSNTNTRLNSNTNTNTNTNNRLNSNTNTNTNANNRLNNTDSNLTLKLSFLKDLTDNKIYNIDFSTVSNNNNYKQNIDYSWDYTNNKLTFYSIPNNNELKNIVFNYNTLNAENQGEIYVWILNILNLSFNEFKKKWNKIADIIPQITDNNKTIMIRNVVDICRN